MMRWPDMPETLITPFSRWILVCAALFGVAALSVDASAQMSQAPPAPPQQGAPVNPMCPRLEAQLATIDRGGGDPAKDEQIRRYQDAAAKQQSELDRVTSQAKRMGCDSSGFFSLFSGQSAQCGPVNFLETLFGNNNNNPVAPPGADLGAQSGTYRTVCVRSCDGAYFPISFATVPGRFPDDERTCKALCPAAEATLYSYRNPGEDMNQAVSINGQPYSSSPNAFRYRQEFNPSCACKAAGQTWSDALKSIDDKAEAEQQGDIIVTEESAKKMARPLTKGVATSKKGAATAATTATAPATPAPEASPPTADSAGAGPDNKPIRSVGPTFIPAR